MLGVILSALLGVVFGLRGSVTSWCIGGAAVVLVTIVFVVAAAVPLYVLPAAAFGYSLGLLVGLLLSTLRRSRSVRTELDPSSHR